ncbi:LysR family transcriptional regulator [Acidocella aminolytica]|jgi:DNA-binding transcriptional LysR family regulator|uniref:Transcriptional regulator LysR n=1 Tax=Acidocella aminolytica 101 = DSM 11237 TaxID=1120923 RepID=A0A0D6PIU3_9PROT|nr:LysR family transcriptional regulator [Acidocella aminolytica]GAN80739.1 transcriptional regulator LysR [Acidocella aminolytica 101 = DSM 11237]GBQ35307.1 LysR family transcriptional regulator [Acidocella aminolytica 101 = DSM 11237]SHF00529.1 DNA-binding transcriptional regulator, LysR family [Acidocella aminolytica 101 = DSM 11237]
MELAQVRYFLALCRTLNFSRAAEACNVTQPAFSRAIQRLEEELGGALIFRERTLTRLTALGLEMRPHFETMVEAAEAAHALAAARRKTAPRSLRIGLGPGIPATPITSAVAEILRVLPGTEIHFTEAPSGTLVDTMLADGLDCALLPDDAPLPERLNRWPLFRDNAALICPETHPLARHNQCRLVDLEGETLLLGHECGNFGDRLTQMAEAPLQTQRMRASASQMQELVRAGLGLALLSNRIVIAPPLATRDFVDPVLDRQVLLTAVAGRPVNQAAAGFMRLCRAQAFD